MRSNGLASNIVERGQYMQAELANTVGVLLVGILIAVLGVIFLALGWGRGSGPRLTK